MRNALVEQLCLLARDDARIFLLTADLGWSVVEAFAREFPSRFLNVGVAEQNMAGIATGLAMVGYRPFIYSIANFATLRCYEQIRNGPVLHRLPVCVVGIGGGYAYGPAGPTHHAVEDLGALRAMPGMRVVAPADPAQTQTVLSATLCQEDPVYLRVGKGGNSTVPGLEGRFQWNAPTIIRRSGDEVLLLATGAMAVEACAAADLLKTHGIAASVGVMAHLPAGIDGRRRHTDRWPFLASRPSHCTGGAPLPIDCRWCERTIGRARRIAVLHAGSSGA
jgi:transketolase